MSGIISKININDGLATVFVNDRKVDSIVVAVEADRFYGNDMLTIKMVNREPLKVNDDPTPMTRKQAEETFNIKLVD